MITTKYHEAAIEADADVPVIRITRDFNATPDQLMAAHTDPALFRRWVGPEGMNTEIVTWDARNGGEWRYVARRGDDAYGFRGCFHTIGEAGTGPAAARSPCEALGGGAH